MQQEATLYEFLFSCAFFNIIVFISFLYRNTKNNNIVFLLLLLFSLYAFWDTDYYSFNEIFFDIKEDFRDPLYYYLSLISFDSYTVFRFLIWGSSLVLFSKSCSRLNIDKSKAYFIFSFFFLLTFSFARASLGMALYFYGLSLILMPTKYNSNFINIKGVIFIILSYWGHRSMLPLILLTPFIFMEYNRKRIIMMLCLIPLFVVLSKNFMDYIINKGDNGAEELSGFSEAVNNYASIEDFTLNWKFQLLTFVRNFSHYSLCAYLMYKIFLNKKSSYYPLYIKRMMIISIIIIFIALVLDLADVGISSVTSKRYLYMSGIPLCIVFTYALQTQKISLKPLSFMVFICLLWSNGYFLGKTFSHYL